MSQADCQHTRELLSTALERTAPGCRKESHSWGTVPSSVGTGAAGGGGAGVPVLGSQRLPNPAWEAPRAAALGSFSKNSQHKGCRTPAPAAGMAKVSCGDGAAR